MSFPGYTIEYRVVIVVIIIVILITYFLPVLLTANMLLYEDRPVVCRAMFHPCVYVYRGSLGTYELYDACVSKQSSHHLKVKEKERERERERYQLYLGSEKVSAKSRRPIHFKARQERVFLAKYKMVKP